MDAKSDEATVLSLSPTSKLVGFSPFFSPGGFSSQTMYWWDEVAGETGRKGVIEDGEEMIPDCVEDAGLRMVRRLLVI